MAPQLSFARRNGIDIHFGDPREEVPGTSIVLPSEPGLVRPRDLDLNRLRSSLVRKAAQGRDPSTLADSEIRFLVDETKSSEAFVREVLAA